eukprot:3288758-Amphidinium_carterae.1
MNLVSEVNTQISKNALDVAGQAAQADETGRVLGATSDDRVGNAEVDAAAYHAPSLRYSLQVVCHATEPIAVGAAFAWQPLVLA